LLLPIIVSSDW